MTFLCVQSLLCTLFYTYTVWHLGCVNLSERVCRLHVLQLKFIIAFILIKATKYFDTFCNSLYAYTLPRRNWFYTFILKNVLPALHYLPSLSFCLDRAHMMKTWMRLVVIKYSMSCFINIHWLPPGLSLKTTRHRWGILLAQWAKAHNVHVTTMGQVWTQSRTLSSLYICAQISCQSLYYLIKVKCNRKTANQWQKVLFLHITVLLLTLIIIQVPCLNRLLLKTTMVTTVKV